MYTTRSNRFVNVGTMTGVIAGTLIAVLVLAYTLYLHPWHMHWGATPDEVIMSLPGDDYIPPSAVVSTRAVTIQAPITAVWPWIAQLGQGRGGFYSYVWLENLFAADMHNAEHIIPELQQLQVGDHIPLANKGPIDLIVAVIDPPHMLVDEGGWAWYLAPIDEKTTRLIVRYPSFVIDDTLTALFYFPIFEPAHFVMEMGMMLGIKQRAERSQDIANTGALSHLTGESAHEVR